VSFDAGSGRDWIPHQYRKDVGALISRVAYLGRSFASLSDSSQLALTYLYIDPYILLISTHTPPHTGFIKIYVLLR
jgi:hypothetical protein